MSNACISDYGKRVKIRLIDMGKSQQWLIGEVMARLPAEDGKKAYFDSGYLYKIIAGKRNPPRIIAAINEILGLESESEGAI